MNSFLLAFGILSPQDDPARLVEILRSDRVEERDQAEKKLRDLGQAALPQLEKATRDPDGEVAARARSLFELIRIRASLSPRILKRNPGIEDRLARGDDRVWHRVFRELISDAQDEPPHVDFRTQEDKKLYALDAKDLGPLAERALRGAETPLEKRLILRVVKS